MAKSRAHDEQGGASAARKPPLHPRRSRLPAVLGLAGVVGLSAAAFAATDAWFAADARQQAADAWARLGRCLLGDGLTADERPSQRLSRIALGLGDQPPATEASWPERCRPHAAALDAALARPALAAAFRSVPPAAAALDPSRSLAQRGWAADSLWSALRRADLPLPEPSGRGNARAVERAPVPAQAALRLRQLHPVVGPSPASWRQVSYDLVSGRLLRLLVGGSERAPTMCELGDGADQRPFGELRCRPLPWPERAAASVQRLSQAAPEAPALLYATGPRGTDGFYDGASGQRLWQPHFADARAFVRGSGEIDILYAVARSAGAQPRAGQPPLRFGSDRIDHLRLVRLVPGRAPTNRRLDIPAQADVLLLDGRLLVWPAQAAGALQAASVLDEEPWLGPAVSVGSLPQASALVGSCAAGEATVALFGPAFTEPRGGHHALAWLAPGPAGHLFDLGVAEAPMVVACDGSTATVTSLSAARAVAQWRCQATGCTRAQSQPLGFLPAAPNAVAFQSVGDRVLVAWASPRAGLRLRLGEPTSLHLGQDQVLLDTEALAALDPARLELSSQQAVAVLWIETLQGSLYAIRIDRAGAPLALDAGS